MKRVLFILILGSWFLVPTQAQPSASRYAGIDGKAGEELFQAISACAAQGHKRISYSGLWQAFGSTDLRPDSTVWDMYSDCDYVLGVVEGKNGQCTSSAKAECDCYQREHSIPKSWWDGHTTPDQYTDLFHLIPADGTVNIVRNNNPYGEVSQPTRITGNGSKYGDCTFPGYTGKAFEPIDAYKGDLARGVLGTITHYKEAWTYSEGKIVFTGVYTPEGNFGLTDYALNLFLKWHRQDPVSQKELDRNNGIEKEQGNRNPFIDYPELVEYIWGNKQGKKLTLGNICSAYDATCVPTDTTNIDDTDDEEEIEITGAYFAKVKTALEDYSGTYLVVYEKDSIALNASAGKIGDAGNYVTVMIEKGIIASTTEIESAAITLAAMAEGYSISNKADRYLLAGNKANTILTSTSPYLHTISLDADANAVVSCTTDTVRVLRYLSSSGKRYFRYYENKANTTSKPIQLYKKHIPTTTNHPSIDGEDVQIGVQGNQLICHTNMPTNVWVYDYMGRLVLNQNNVTQLTHTLSSGIYLVKMGNVTQKIRINK